MVLEIDFDAPALDAQIITLIVARAGSIDGWTYGGLNLLDLEMTITAVHLNGCPLDLQKFLDAPAFDFAHDILGMLRHINKEDGSLNNFFDPRCSLPEHA